MKQSIPTETNTPSASFMYWNKNMPVMHPYLSVSKKESGKQPASTLIIFDKWMNWSK
jgi:hypothetical protein